MSEEKKSFKGALFTLGGKLVSVFIKLLKGLKFLKFGLAAATFGSYAFLFTWKFALLVLFAIGWHESGHVAAMKKIGISTKGFYFLPFMGGVAVGEEDYKYRYDNVYVSIMGPIFGLALAAMTGLCYYATGMQIFAAAAGWMATINLFNLLPISPLDGGQIMRAIAFSLHRKIGIAFLLIGIVISTIMLFKFNIGLFALILIVGTIDLLFELYLYKYKDDNRRKLLNNLNENNYYNKQIKDNLTKKWMEKSIKDLTKKQIAITVISYIGVVVALILIVTIMKTIPGADLAANFLE